MVQFNAAGMEVTTREQILQKIWAKVGKRVPRNVSLADELLQDRRREAAKEDRK